MNLSKALILSFTTACLSLSALLPAWAAPPVRIAVVPGGASGMEQDVVDRINDQLQTNSSVKLSTVNPDWYVVCNINDKTDLVGQTVRVNGTVTIKTVDGHILDTISVQTNKQDFNLNPGTPAPMNKALVDSAVREVIAGMAQRAVGPISDAVEVEIQTRDKIIHAQNLADEDKYSEALEILMTISPDTPHFKGARALIAEFQMEQQAIDLIREAQASAKKGNYHQAIGLLKAVNPKSKRYSIARSMLASLTRPHSRVVRSSPKPAATSGDQMKALQAQKRALDAQRKAIEAQEAALKARGK